MAGVEMYDFESGTAGWDWDVVEGEAGLWVGAPGSIAWEPSEPTTLMLRVIRRPGDPPLQRLVRWVQMFQPDPPGYYVVEGHPEPSDVLMEMHHSPLRVEITDEDGTVRTIAPISFRPSAAAPAAAGRAHA